MVACCKVTLDLTVTYLGLPPPVPEFTEESEISLSSCIVVFQTPSARAYTEPTQVIGAARIFSGVHFFPQKVDDPFY